jgi:hypothetical protein
VNGDVMPTTPGDDNHARDCKTDLESYSHEVKWKAPSHEPLAGRSNCQSPPRKNCRGATSLTLFALWFYLLDRGLHLGQYEGPCGFSEQERVAWRRKVCTRRNDD